MNKQPQPEIKRNTGEVASLAVFFDGYVTRLDGAVDFLEKYPLADFDFGEWAERIGALVMGRKNYQQLLAWGKWLWDDHPTLTLTIMPESLCEEISLFSEPYRGPMRIIIPYSATTVLSGSSTTQQLYGPRERWHDRAFTAIIGFRRWTAGSVVGRRNLRRVGSLSFVTLRDGEDPEQLLKRFQTQMQRSGILRDLRNRRFFRSKGEQERLDKARSLRRLRRRRNR